ncbi:MAG: DUF2007 domain-containing protein [Lysobacter sp.]|nr:DUF2007 domain-containing protein [Lysobacter sp.]
MQIIYRAANLADAHLVRQLLESEDIPAFVQGEYLQGAVGELPANTEVFVHVHDAQVDAARAVVADWESGEPVVFDDEDPDDAGHDAAGAVESTLARAHAIGVKRLLLFVAVVVGGVICYEMLLRYAAG